MARKFKGYKKHRNPLVNFWRWLTDTREEIWEDVPDPMKDLFERMRRDHDKPDVKPSWRNVDTRGSRDVKSVPKTVPKEGKTSEPDVDTYARFQYIFHDYSPAPPEKDSFESYGGGNTGGGGAGGSWSDHDTSSSNSSSSDSGGDSGGSDGGSD